VVSTDHFRQELIMQLRRAAEEGATTIVVTSTDLADQFVTLATLWMLVSRQCRQK
jgi:hypothetical protein